MVSTPLKNISQLSLLFPIYEKNVPYHQPVYYILTTMVMILPVVTFSPYGSKAPDPVKASASVGTSTGADSWDVTTGAQKKEMLMGILW